MNDMDEYDRITDIMLFILVSALAGIGLSLAVLIIIAGIQIVASW